MRIMSVFGTRPEAIKLAPVLKELSASDDIESIVCVTGQHREMLDQVNALFGVVPDIDLKVMARGQSITHVTTAVLQGLEAVFDRIRPDWVVVQGDTTSAFAAGLAAFFRRIPVAHVEAGLRTGNPLSPWPEEMNRRLTACVTGHHFAPTREARNNLLREGISAENIDVTGNTVIDALFEIRNMLRSDTRLATEMRNRFGFLDPKRRVVLVTGHRRENFDGGLARVCEALGRLASRGDVQVVYPVHLNPAVQTAAQATLTGTSNVFLLPPLEYLPFVWLMDRAYLIVTDSGGVQEEAPSLGKPVLVTRDTTERPEAVAAGTVRLVGTNPERIIAEANDLLDNTTAYYAMARTHNPYGDGKAAPRIVARLLGKNLTPPMAPWNAGPEAKHDKRHTTAAFA
jgi:UDP-N-acetylglucosamine 2-epimerase (non-hydrolysing)